MSELTSPVPPYWRGVEGPPWRALRTARVLASGYVRAGWSVRVHARHQVPRTGPVILASNHAGFLDGPLLCAVTARPVHTLVKCEMFRGPVGKALRRLGQISVERQVVDIGAVRSSLAVLDRGDVLGIYPEGTRGSGDFAKIKPGVAYLALCTGAPVVPVACLGTRPVAGADSVLPPLRTRVDVVSVRRSGWRRRRGPGVATSYGRRHAGSRSGWSVISGRRTSRPVGSCPASRCARSAFPDPWWRESPAWTWRTFREQRSHHERRRVRRG